MADLISHVLIAFTVFTVVGWFVKWLEPQWVVVAMVGAILPDLNRLGLLLEASTIELLLGIPFSWGAIHTLAGVILLSAIGALLFATRERQIRAFALLLGGGMSHLVVDGVKAWADGYNGAYLYPFSWWRNPTPGWYVSADRWVLVGCLVVAISAFVVDRWYVRER